jgi:hypothetical protein
MADTDPYADETPEEAPPESGHEERHPSFIGRLFARKERETPSDEGTPREMPKKESPGVAHVPTAVLSVQYIDDGPAMDAAIKELEKKLAQMEKMLNAIQETTRSLATGFNRQNRDVIQMVESVTRRLDILYRRFGAGADVTQTPTPPPQAEPRIKPAVEPMEEIPPVPEKFVKDPEHKRAQRIAKVMASDLEAYNESKVKEGILYGNFHELLASQIKDAQDTYEERVPERVRSEYDYFTVAINELIQRKKEDLLGQQSGAGPESTSEAEEESEEAGEPPEVPGS